MCDSRPCRPPRINHSIFWATDLSAGLQETFFNKSEGYSLHSGTVYYGVQR